jgi:hypothetical protein
MVPDGRSVLTYQDNPGPNVLKQFAENESKTSLHFVMIEIQE